MFCQLFDCKYTHFCVYSNQLILFFAFKSGFSPMKPTVLISCLYVVVVRQRGRIRIVSFLHFFISPPHKGGAGRGSVPSFNYPQLHVASSRQSAFRRQSSAFPSKRPSISVYILFTFSLQIIYILYLPTLSMALDFIISTSTDGTFTSLVKIIFAMESALSVSPIMVYAFIMPARGAKWTGTMW